MTRLPTDLYNLCVTILSSCSEFESDNSLRSVFNTNDLYCFHAKVEEATSINERVAKCLKLLLSSQLDDGRTALPVFLFTLRDKYQQGDAQRKYLEDLANAVLATFASSGISSTAIISDQITQRISGFSTIEKKNPVELVAELTEWKLIHNESQALLNALNTPLDYLIAYRFKPDPDKLDEAGFKWQACARKLRSVPDKWNLQYAYTSVLDDLREQTSNLNEITRVLMQTDIQKPEFKVVYSQIEALKEVLWDILTVADKRIMVLVENLKTIIGA